MNENELSLSRLEQAEMLRQDILTSCTLVQKNLWDMCMNLKKMRDEKLYKELGFSEFNDFTQKELGMSDRNVYRYISVAEKVSPDLVTPVSRFGIKKLALLARLSDEEQKEIAEKIDETTTYKQLQEEINRIKGEKLKLENERERLNAKLKAEAANVEEARSDLERAEKELKIAQIKSAAEMDRANRTADKLRDKEREAARLERENKELRERPVEVAVVDNSDSERRIQETIRSLERENIKRNEEMDKRYIEERRDLEERKNKEVAAIRAEYEEKLRAAQDQSGEPDKEKQEFKILLVMAHDAVNRLVSFANSHKKRIYTEKAGDLLAASAAALKE